ncbi:hypothetical protein R3I94_006996 [Phoxinus phoxinus]
MAEQAQKRSADRHVLYCLLCHKPQDNLSAHLNRVCMKNSTPEQREAELKKAKVSHREWVRHNRRWDYNQLCVILPDQRSRMAMLKELLRRGFFVENQPQEVEDEEARPASAAAADPPE